MDGGSKEQRLADFAIFVSIGFLIGFAWFKVYVEPREQFLMEVVECMNTVSDHSESSYNLCAKEVRGR